MPSFNPPASNALLQSTSFKLPPSDELRQMPSFNRPPSEHLLQTPSFRAPPSNVLLQMSSVNRPASNALLQSTSFVNADSQDRKIYPTHYRDYSFDPSDGPASVCSQQLGKHFITDMPCVNVFYLYLTLLINERNEMNQPPSIDLPQMSSAAVTRFPQP